MTPLLDVQGMETQFSTQAGAVHAVNGVSFHVSEGETLGIVGESGSGKSVTMLSVLRLIPSPPGRITSGRVLFEGRDLLTLSRQEMRSIRGNRISMIFQDPMTSLNPVLTIGRQLTEPIELHMGLTSRQAESRAVELLELVGMSDASRRLKSYPHQFSGGMRQRVMIAMGLSTNPKLLIADEPTTALDVTIQAQIVELVKRLRHEFGMAMVWITHDLSLLAGLADRIMVMYAGQVVEEAPLRDLYRNPRHPYTIGLLQSVPRLDEVRRDRLRAIDGTPPDLINYPTGCPFRPRCPFAIDKCAVDPPLEAIDSVHSAACWVKPQGIEILQAYRAAAQEV